jgi:glycosyltransferase involved in cell wall biosynthesis
MLPKIRLSIVIITMNRKDQLLEALKSCTDCNLPEDTEFIIIDNASTDGTENAVKEFFVKNEFHYIYIRLPQNKGVGGGRNEGFDIARGQYVYFMDDDAVIDSNCTDTFFIKSIELMDRNPKIATLTTRIWDKFLQDIRHVNCSKHCTIEGFNTISMFMGGSHFVRTKAFEKPLYPNFKYAFEEIIPSFIALDKGYYNLYYPEISIIHKPRINKWLDGTKQKKDILCRGNAGLLASKYLLYPVIFRPLLFAAFIARWYVHLRKYKGGLSESWIIFREQTKGIKTKKIKSRTVVKIFKEFGFGAGV